MEHVKYKKGLLILKKNDLKKSNSNIQAPFAIVLKKWGTALAKPDTADLEVNNHIYTES